MRLLGVTWGFVVGVGLCGAFAYGCKSDVECKKTLAESTIGPCSVTSSTSDICFEQPQVCPDLSPVRFCSRVNETETSVNLLLKNRGENDLVISAIKVRGDSRCAYIEPQMSPAPGTPIRPDDSMVVRFKYKPPSNGEDHIALEVTSNAERPTLFIPVCGKGIARLPSGPDGGVVDAGEAASRVVGPDCLPCQDKSAAEYTTCWDMPSGM